MHDLTEITDDGRMLMHFHPGQWAAWESKRRFIGIIAGTQSGKTSYGPLWLFREIKERGAGDYLVVTPTFALLEKKALPEFLKHFQRRLKVGTYVGSPVRKFTFSEEGSLRTFGSYDADNPTVVFFGYAEDPESLESSTAKAAWLDEAGQKKFKLGSWEAILRRLSLAQGRALITTTPYDLGWLKQEIYDRWKDGDPLYEVVRFDSTENPQFPQEEFERARESLPDWKFNLFYRGIFTRPAGMIYDSFNEDKHVIPRFDIPAHWPRFLGLDFGGVNTAGVFFAEERNSQNEPTGRLILYRIYKAGGKTAKEHAQRLMLTETKIPLCVGGSHSEDQWRNEFKKGGLPVQEPPIKDVEVGIDRVYGCHKRDEILVFSDLKPYLEQKLTYSRELDDSGNPTEKIEDKETFHLLDAERYIISRLRNTPERKPVQSFNYLQQNRRFEEE
jgi:hypothetical protein